MPDSQADASMADDLDPVKVFAARLRQLKDESGKSVRALEKQTNFHRSTIDDKLHGRTPPDWKFVEAFVRACVDQPRKPGEPEEPGLRPWREWHAQMKREQSRRTEKRRVVDDRVCPYRGLEPFTVEHSAWFHGRATAVDCVLDRLACWTALRMRM